MSIQIAKQLNIGDTFYENGYGTVITATVTTKPTCVEGQWRWEAITTMGDVISYLITEGFEHYGPNITLDSWE